MLIHKTFRNAYIANRSKGSIDQTKREEVILEMETELTFTKDGVTIKVPLKDTVPFLKDSSHVETLSYDQLQNMPMTLTVSSIQRKLDENGSLMALTFRVSSNQLVNTTVPNERVPDRVEISLNQSAIEYYLIPLHKVNRKYFPPYKTYFDLDTNVGLLRCYVGGDSASVQPGDPEGGYYIIKGLKPWFKKNNIKKDDKVFVEVIEHGKKYRLVAPETAKGL